MPGWVEAARCTPVPPPPARWMRVSHARPCPICGKPDWCSIDAADGTVLCMRVGSGAQQRLDLGHGVGFLHKPNGDVFPTRMRSATPADRYVSESTQPFKLDYEAIFRRWRARTSATSVDMFAERLGVSRVSLERLGVVRCDERKAWAFPMHDAIRRVVGVRFRSDDGCKFALPGSHSGLFIPAGLESRTKLLICEGPTDTAAALTLGFDAIGRPSCSGGTEHLCNLIQAGRRRDVIIVADSDGPGRAGAIQLADRLLGISGTVKNIETHPHKDLRAWLRVGCRQVSLLHLIERAPMRERDGSCSG